MIKIKRWRNSIKGDVWEPCSDHGRTMFGYITDMEGYAK